jgi:CRISPR-associated protein Csm3
MSRLTKSILLSGQIKLLTGLRIGDSKDSVEIGGVDLPVVRRKDNSQPYLPGSSIKGKMRCLLEQAYGIVDNSFDDLKGKTGSDISALFGSKGNFSCIRVRDAFMEPKSAEQFFRLESTDMPYTEVKFENTIDRVRGVALHPRQIERVPAGAVFEVNFVINVFAENDDKARENEKQLLSTFRTAFNLLLDDYLGGHGSRGYGQIELINGKLSRTDKSYRLDGDTLKIEISPASDYVIVPSAN